MKSHELIIHIMSLSNRIHDKAKVFNKVKVEINKSENKKNRLIIPR